MIFVLVVKHLAILAYGCNIYSVSDAATFDDMEVKRSLVNIGLGKHTADSIVIDDVITLVTTDVCMTERILGEINRPL